MSIPIDERAKMNQEIFRNYRDARSDWENEARIDMEFYLGNHFTSEESDELHQETKQIYLWTGYLLQLKN